MGYAIDLEIHWKTIFTAQPIDKTGNFENLKNQEIMRISANCSEEISNDFFFEKK